MNCLKAEEQFSAYLEDELDYPSLKAFEAHLASCEQCHHEFTRFCEAVNLLHQMPSIPPSPEFDAHLHAHLANLRIEPIPFWHRLLNPLQARPIWALGGIAALFIMVAGIYVYSRTPVKFPAIEVSTEPNTPIPTEVRRNPRWRQELPLAVPNLHLYPVVKFPTSSEFDAQPSREAQPPRRMERNYILQTVSYTDIPTGGGL